MRRNTELMTLQIMELFEDFLNDHPNALEYGDSFEDLQCEIELIIEGGK